MSNIQIENLTFAYSSGNEPIFENVNLNISTDWKLGFVGRNGRGKTTFLNLLMGKYEYKGKISSPVKFDYFPYPVHDDNDITLNVLRGVCVTGEDWQFMRELSLLDVSTEVLYRPLNTLSYGEKTKVMLSAMFVNEGNFLLIDEPTNHLDYAARKTLAAYLRKKRGYILVSHDREFLDGCVDHILSLNKCDIALQSGNFTAFLTDFERRQQYEIKQNARLQSDIQRLQGASAQTALWSDKVESTKNGTKNSGLRPDKGYIGHNSAKMMKRSKVIEARIDRQIEEKSALLKNVEAAPKLKINSNYCHAQRLVSLTNVVPYYDGKAVTEPVTFTVERGDTVALDGFNGCGKSSILKIISGLNIEFTGILKTAPHIKISYLPQDKITYTGTLSDFAKSENIDESLFKAILNKLGFNKDIFRNDMSSFSLGQNKKIAIAKSLCEQADLYVWDEPLNYVDVFSRIQIEDLIAEYRPSMIFVEHDYVFRNKIATKKVEIKKLYT